MVGSYEKSKEREIYNTICYNDSKTSKMASSTGPSGGGRKFWSSPVFGSKRRSEKFRRTNRKGRLRGKNWSTDRSPLREREKKPPELPFCGRRPSQVFHILYYLKNRFNPPTVVDGQSEYSKALVSNAATPKKVNQKKSDLDHRQE